MIERRMSPLTLLASLTVLIITAGLNLADAQPFPSARNPIKWPFAQNSIWNMPIGSMAVYVDAHIKAISDTSVVCQRGMSTDPDVLILTPDAPLTDISLNTAGWSGGDRCVVEGNVIIKAPIPVDFIVAGGGTCTPNHSAAVLMPDGRTLKQNQPFSRCTAGGPATSQYVYPDGDLYGDGIEGAHGGSGLSSLGGTLRLGELVPGAPPIRHALKINICGKDNIYYDAASGGYRWPATKADGYAADGYHGQVKACLMGALLAIPIWMDIEKMGLQTEPAHMLAWTLQNYGGYLADDTWYDKYGIETEESPDGTIEQEFKSVWGFDINEYHPASPWLQDMTKILTSLHVVDNNSPDSIGGGGTPLQPLAPPFGEDAAAPLEQQPK